MTANLVVLILSGILAPLAAVLAWVAKLRWSREFRDAKEAQLAAKEAQLNAKDGLLATKDAQIAQLERELKNVKDLYSPDQLVKVVEAVKSLHEEQRTLLQGQLDSTLKQITEKDEELKSLRDTTAEYKSVQSRLQSELSALERRALALQGQKQSNEVTLEILEQIPRTPPQLRRAILDAYKSACAFTGPAPSAVLELTHLVPRRLAPDLNYKPENILLVRSDIHSLVDRGDLSIDPETSRIVVSPALNGTPYWELGGRLAHLPEDQAMRPGSALLAQHLRAARERWEGRGIGSERGVEADKAPQP